MKLFVMIMCVNYHIFVTKASKVDSSNDPVEKSPKFSKDVVFPPVPPEYWTADGECADNPTFVEDCPVWAEMGFCDNEEKGKQYVKWMRKHCMASCKICKPTSQPFKIALKLCAGILVLIWLAGFIRFPRVYSSRKCFKLLVSMGLATCLYFV
ncbi:uncharacterized protein LOC100185812 [Ciona intestinalis]